MPPPFLIIVLAMLISTSATSTKIVDIEGSARQEVVQLLDSEGSFCTGVEVIAPSGKVYTLTAAHCIAGNSLSAKLDTGLPTEIKLIDEDPLSDLALYEGLKGSKGVQVASSPVVINDRVFALTHGARRPTYRSDGVSLKEGFVRAPMFEITNRGALEECAALPKLEIHINGDTGEVTCVLATKEIATTARIVPGSSGGPLFNPYGRLVGIASIYNDDFGYFVRTEDIVRFLAGR